MKLDIRRLFLRSSNLGLPLGGNLDDAADTNFHQGSGGAGEGLEAEYRELIAGHFSRWGIRSESVTIEVKKSGQAPDGFDVFVAMVRLVKWDRHSGLRLLLGLPLMENKIRKTVRATWLADYSHFAGMWVHVSENVQVPDDLRGLLTTLAPSSREVPDSKG